MRRLSLHIPCNGEVMIGSFRVLKLFLLWLQPHDHTKNCAMLFQMDRQTEEMELVVMHIALRFRGWVL